MTTENLASPPHIRSVLEVIRPVFFRNRYRLALGFAALIGVDFLQLIIPRLLKRAVDALSAGTATQSGLLTIGFFIILTASGAAVLRFCWRYLIIGFSRLLELDLRKHIFSHVLKMDRAFFDRRTTGDIMAHSSNDLQAVQMACGMGLVSAVDALVMTVAALGFMIHINLQLTLIALLPMPFLAICTRVLTGKLHHRFTVVQEQFSLLTEFVRSTLVSMRLVKAYTMENLQKKQFAQLGRKYVRGNIRVAVIHGLLFPVAALVGNLGMLLVLYYGGRLAINGVITLGDFVAFVTYLYMLVWPMMAIGWVANMAQRGLTSLGRIRSLVSTAALLQDTAAGVRPDRDQPSFRLQNLTFTFPSAAHPVLQDISLSLYPGLYGITGRTGSGKSALCKILVRMYPVPDRSLFYKDRDVNILSLDDVREEIAYVGQEAVLFSDTIAGNIAFGRAGADRDEIIAAARSAAIHEDIMRLPRGYETRIGERGVKLSGGQKQRLALARALLSNRPVLIIDDALAALDVETEHQVLTEIGKTARGRLLIIVSQRIKILSETDEIIILDEGRIAARGEHDRLLRENEFYKFMNDKQSRELAGPGPHDRPRILNRL
ncbi:MAG: ABC transporter transmembrane domain-containing protein [Desulfobulbaceae bacterium]|nr:ABC transporter transmembrane domain-containing protein [Desulfobulbaceae bacterium]